MKFLPRKAEIGYIAGGGTAACLFIFHTLVIFEMAYLLTLTVEDAIHVMGLHMAGPAIILSGFVALFFAHILEAVVWATVLWRLGELPTFGEAVYFAGTSLTTLGYGDIVLRAPYRMLGPIMAISGILMFGCSTAFLFFVIQRVWQTIG